MWFVMLVNIEQIHSSRENKESCELRLGYWFHPRVMSELISERFLQSVWGETPRAALFAANGAYWKGVPDPGQSKSVSASSCCYLNAMKSDLRSCSPGNSGNRVDRSTGATGELEVDRNKATTRRAQREGKRG
jgi:hypothetical protein